MAGGRAESAVGRPAPSRPRLAPSPDAGKRAGETDRRRDSGSPSRRRTQGARNIRLRARSASVRLVDRKAAPRTCARRLRCASPTASLTQLSAQLACSDGSRRHASLYTPRDPRRVRARRLATLPPLDHAQAAVLQPPGHRKEPTRAALRRRRGVRARMARGPAIPEHCSRETPGEAE